MQYNHTKDCVGKEKQQSREKGQLKRKITNTRILHGSINHLYFYGVAKFFLTIWRKYITNAAMSQCYWRSVQKKWQKFLFGGGPWSTLLVNSYATIYPWQQYDRKTIKALSIGVVRIENRLKAVGSSMNLYLVAWKCIQNCKKKKKNCS